MSGSTIRAGTQRAMLDIGRQASQRQEAWRLLKLKPSCRLTIASSAMTCTHCSALDAAIAERPDSATMSSRTTALRAVDRYHEASSLLPEWHRPEALLGMSPASHAAPLAPDSSGATISPHFCRLCAIFVLRRQISASYCKQDFVDYA